MAYLTYGFGDDIPWLFLPPFPFDHHIWKKIWKVLPSSWKRVAVDYPGFGWAAEPVAYQLDDLAAELAQQLPKVHLVGISMGGYVAFAMARRYPGQVASMVLICTHPFADSPERRQNRQRQIEALKAGHRQAVLKGYYSGLLAPTFYQQEPDESQALWQLLQQAPDAAMIAALQAMAQRPDSSPYLPNMTMPVTIIAGQHDSLIPLEQYDQWAVHLPHRQMYTLPTGHLPIWEDPNAVVRLLKAHRKWLTEFSS